MMGNARHGGRRFRGIRESMQRRTWEGAANARRESEADIVRGLYVGPDGRGYDVIQDIETGEQYTVQDLTGGRTMAPGSKVPIARYSGSREGFRIGAPPGGGAKFGAPPRGRRPYATVPPVVEADQYAFGYGATDLWAALYSGGAYVSDRGTNGSAAGIPAGIILSDSSELVGDGSLILADEDDSEATAFEVWDVAGETLHTHTVASGWKASPPRYGGGFLWWIELADQATAHADASLSLRLRRSTTQLGSVTTVQTHSAAAGAGSFNHYHGSDGRYVAALTEDALIAYAWALPKDAGHSGSGGPYNCHRVRFPFDGSAASGTTFEATFTGDYELDDPVGSGTVNDAGTSTLIEYHPTSIEKDVRVLVQANTSASAPTEIWPATIFDDPEGPASVACFNVSPAGTAFQVYGGGKFGRASSTAAATAWASKGTAESHPTQGSPPDAVFYFGED